MGKYEVPDLSDIEPEVGTEMIKRIARGDLTTQVMTARVAKNGLNAFMMRKIEHHIGEVTDGNYLSKVEAAPSNVTGALAHETDHVDAIADAYDNLIEQLEAYQECFKNNVHQSAENN